MELTIAFMLSQAAMFLAMGTDFLSLQFKRRQTIYAILVVSAALISSHYFLLGKNTAGIIVFFSVFRFITCIFTTNKKYLYIFLVLNTLAVIFTFSEIYDLIIYVGLTIFIIGNFQKNDRLMRKQMMIGTSLVIIYNALIFSPMGMITEGVFLAGNIIGYYRHYIKNKEV